MKIVRTEQEVNQLLNECVEAEEMGTTKFPGMTYEQGLKDAIEWLCGDSSCYPLDDWCDITIILSDGGGQGNDSIIKGIEIFV